MPPRLALLATVLAATFTLHASPAEAQGQGKGWDRNALFPPGSKLAEVEAVKKEQATAESLMKQLVGPFKKALVIRGKPANARIGRTIAIKVLSTDDYRKREAMKADAEYEEDLRALLRYRPEWVKQRLDRIAKQQGLPSPYRVVDENTKLRDSDKAMVMPRLHRPTDSGAAFYSSADDTIYIKVGQVGVEVMAHEMTHAYASKAWNDVQLQIVAFGLLGEINKLDEAMTSELAGLALDAWFDAQPRGSRPEKAPSGYVGYGASYEAQGAAIQGAVDPGSRLAAYFGGDVRVSMNAKTPIASRMKLGRANVALSELFTRR